MWEVEQHEVFMNMITGSSCKSNTTYNWNDLLCLYVTMYKYVKHGSEESLCIGSLDGSEFRECVFEFGDCIVTSFKWQYKNMLELEIYFQV